MTTIPTKAGANPTKEFFVRMITRDISLEDCIMDLIDNSVDGAWRCEGGMPMGLSQGADLSAYRIIITIVADRFAILDNCGGMSVDDARDHAFSFGRRTDDRHDDYSIGVYGIGMKRAVFKLGTRIRIRSTHADAAGGQEAFVVPIDVPTWMGDDEPPWDFDIEPDEPLTEHGVAVEVEALTQGASQAFGSQVFIQNLRRMIGRDYSMHLDRGLEIVLNDEPIVGWMIALRSGEAIAPMRSTYADEVEGNEVMVEIIGGMAAPPPDDVAPDDDDEGDKRFGWYVACNGRIVLAADKTGLSGWGSDLWPQWHSQYSGFMGLILFTAAQAVALPLTTTKRSVDTTSEIYRRARPRMREVTRAWIDYTNARKQAMEEARRFEAAALPVAIRSVALRPGPALPTFTARPPTERSASVNYSVPLTRLRKLARQLGDPTMTQRDVGLRSFDYTYDELVEED